MPPLHFVQRGYLRADFLATLHQFTDDFYILLHKKGVWTKFDVLEEYLVRDSF